MAASARIGDYAVIGDGRSAALVSQSGSVDWLSWPRFDSPSLFARLLDADAGHWRIAPAGASAVERSYLADTNVLETRFRTASGAAVVTDLMPVASEEDKARRLWPEHHLLRLVECTEGEVAIEMEFAARPGYALERPRLRAAGRFGVRIETRDGLLLLRCDGPLDIAGDDTVRSLVHLTAGQSMTASLTFAAEGPAIAPALEEARELIAVSAGWWRTWCGTRGA